MRSTILTLLFSALTVWSMVGLIAWVVRDGLGPDSVESHGWEALTRFCWTFYWAPVFVALAATATLFALSFRRHPLPTSDDTKAA